MPITLRTEAALSDLSVTEFLTLSRAGFLPMGLVIGTSVFDAGRIWNFGGMQEIKELSTAMHTARRLAVDRMRAQAKQHRAEGVVGVRLEVEHHRWRGGHTVAKLIAVGTAIAFDREHAPQSIAHAPSLLLQGERPFTSDLSGQDFVTLIRAGVRPIDLTMGSAVYSIDPTYVDAYRASSSAEEMVAYTQVFFDAREAAMDRLTEDLHRDHPRGSPDSPAGIVGVTVEEKFHEGDSWLVEYSAIGTAVAPLHDGDPRRVMQPNPTIVVPLDR